MEKLGWLTGVVIALAGCAEPLHLVDRSSSAGVSPYSFWPPPPSSALWLPSGAPLAPNGGLGPVSPTGGLGPVASELKAGLAHSGYADSRWYPIGTDYQHGFAVTTRLERLDRDQGSDARRWSALYPLPADLRWLTFAQAPPLPQRGQYRAFLIAFTDLPMPMRGQAPTWNEQTLMDGPGAPEQHELAYDARRRRYTARYRFGVYEYVYDWDEAEKRGRLRASATERTKALEENR